MGTLHGEKLSVQGVQSQTGSRVTLEMESNIDKLVELKSQVAELRDYLIGQQLTAGCATGAAQPDLDLGLIGCVLRSNAAQNQLITDIQDMVLEIRNCF